MRPCTQISAATGVSSDQKSGQEVTGPMKTLSLTEVKARLSELVDEVESRDERVVITRKGRPAAVLVSQDDLESWQETLEIASDPEFMAEIRRGVREIERGQTVGYETVFIDKPRRKKRSVTRAR